MATVVLSDKAEQRLNDLIDILHDRKYFGLRDTARVYSDKLRAFAASIPVQTRRLCRNSRYGKWYCTYKANRHPTWYFTFDTDEEYFIVRNVLNNHTREYPTYIRGIK